MSNKMLLTTKLDQRLAMNPQLRQAITLLQYNTIDLRQFVQQCMEKNPFLDLKEEESNLESVEFEQQNEFEQESYDTYTSNKYNNSIVSDRFTKNDNYLENYAVPKSLREHLLEQTLLCKFNIQDQMIAEAIIDAIDDDGYLTMSLNDIQQALAEVCTAKTEHIKSILSIIQMFDPLGVGAENIQQCLLLQLQSCQKDKIIISIAKEMILKFFEKNNFSDIKKVMNELHISKEQYQQAIAIINGLDLKPGQRVSNEIQYNVEPDLYVKKIRNTWKVFLTENILTNIKINDQYQSLVKNNKDHQSYENLNKELQEAQWLLKGLKRRNETLLKVATYIMQFQKDFLEHGHSVMKAMNIVDVAQALQLHESTISRVTTGKYIATPQGFFELKYFFPSHVLTENGTTCSDTAVKELIKQIIHSENSNHIYSDGEIAKLLKEKGINIARRTVAKYRDSLKILPSNQRSASTVKLATE